jgi:hypothetical protein
VCVCVCVCERECMQLFVKRMCKEAVRMISRCAS